jgi:hypothetical protein
MRETESVNETAIEINIEIESEIVIARVELWTRKRKTLSCGKEINIFLISHSLSFLFFL